MAAQGGTLHSMHRIPATMATQHPDNASAPYWEKDGDAFVSVAEELDECVACFKDLGVEEFMWDWEGKYADESVIEKLFSSHFDFFKRHKLGKDIFLTFRLPNVWKEKGYSLIRALMVMLTSEDVAYDVKLKNRPLFEAILPMTESAEQIMYIHEAFRKLARFKSDVFNQRRNTNNDYLHLIPLVEGVDDQIHVRTLLEKYVTLHQKKYGKKPPYMRPFLARSDPALLSGFVPNVLANKIALSDIYAFGKKVKVPMYPWIGAGSLVFRGGISPIRAKQFVDEYRGIRTVTIQSAFRYDYPLKDAKKAIRYLKTAIPKSSVQVILDTDRKYLESAIEKFSALYQTTVAGILPDLEPIFKAVPRRRERRQHIGLLAYTRTVGKKTLPRAINFTAACYSLGIPPEFIGLGRALMILSDKEVAAVKTYYRHFKSDVVESGRYLNRDNVERLAQEHSIWRKVKEDIILAEEFFGVRFAPKTHDELLHQNLTSQLLLQRGRSADLSHLIVETGKLRRSLG